MTQTTGRIYDEFAKLMTDAAGVARACGARSTLPSEPGGADLRELDYVTRDEFEAVKEMAAKARDENERLAAKIADAGRQARAR